MFRVATTTARRYTRPVVRSWRDADGRVSSSVGTFIVLNDAGWVATSAHLFGSLATPPPPDAASRGDPASRTGSGGASARPTARSWWWSRDGIRLVERTIVAEADLAIGRLDPFPADLVDAFPVFLDVSC